MLKEIGGCVRRKCAWGFCFLLINSLTMIPIVVSSSDLGEKNRKMEV